MNTFVLYMSLISSVLEFVRINLILENVGCVA